MDVSRRAVLGLVAASAVAGCSGSGGGDGGGNDEDTDTLPGQGDGDGSDGGTGDDGDNGETSPKGSCGSLFGDTLQQYDTGDRGMIATFSYPMGGEQSFEQSDDRQHLTTFGYGRGEVSSLHGLLVGEAGPLGGPDTAPAAYEQETDAETASVTTYGGQTVPAHVRREPDSVTYLVRVEGPDGTYELSALAEANEGEPCPEVYDAVARRVIESFEPVA